MLAVVETSFSRIKNVGFLNSKVGLVVTDANRRINSWMHAALLYYENTKPLNVYPCFLFYFRFLISFILQKKTQLGFDLLWLI